MTSKKFDSVVIDFNEAVTTYLTERKVSNINELPLKHRVAQISVIQRVIDSLQGTNNDARKLTAFIYVMAETISVTPFIGSSILKNQIQACALKHIPSDHNESKDKILKAKFFISFFNFFKDNHHVISNWFQGHNDMGKNFNNKFFELLLPAVKESYEIQRDKINQMFDSNTSDSKQSMNLKSTTPPENALKYFEPNTRISTHSMMTRPTTQKNDSVQISELTGNETRTYLSKV